MPETSSFAADFYSLFADGFRRACEPAREALLPQWLDKSAWTAFMLRPDTGFLSGAADRWAKRHFNEACSAKYEWHKFDLMLVKGDAGAPWWRSVPLLTIEHENDNSIQDEVWKLACWRSRLKVLITYHDHAAQEAEKRTIAAEIISSVQADDDRAEWLLLSAPRTWRDQLSWSAYEWAFNGWRSLRLPEVSL